MEINDLKINYKEKRTTSLANKGDVYYIQYDALNELDFIKHGISTRFGGVSTGIFESMNLNFTRGDEKDKVVENYKRICDALDMDVNKLVCSYQTHTNNVIRVGETPLERFYVGCKTPSGVDGLVTNVPGVVLTTSFADCIPLLFADPVKKCIGLSHAGWRGTVGKIAKNTIDKMINEYGSKASDIICCIGPGICKDCYEVSEDVHETFKESLSNRIVYEAFDDRGIINGKHKYLLDLWQANRMICLEAGLRDYNIYLPDICTNCNPDLLFSHRASKGRRGNFNVFLSIKYNS